jgi:hypothetical protein
LPSKSSSTTNICRCCPWVFRIHCRLILAIFTRTWHMYSFSFISSDSRFFGLRESSTLTSIWSKCICVR